MKSKVKNRMMVAALAVGAVSALLLGAAMTPTAAFASTADSAVSTATVSFNPGKLKLMKVPDFGFGAHIIDGTTSAFQAQASGTATVEDLRGNLIGYNLTVVLSNFKDSTNAASLNGATIDLQGGALQYQGDGPSPANPKVNTALHLVAGNGAAVKVLDAEVGTGSGCWDITWGAANVTLTVPTSSQASGSHAATLSWTLADVPA